MYLQIYVYFAHFYIHGYIENYAKRHYNAGVAIQKIM